MGTPQLQGLFKGLHAFLSGDDAWFVDSSQKWPIRVMRGGL